MMQVGFENPNPDFIKAHRATVQRFIGLCHGISMALLQGLERKLGMAPGTLVNLHNISEPSGDQIRCIKCPPQSENDRSTALGEHTDFGSFTVLFNRISGLRVVEPGIQNAYEDWPWVRPKPSHAIINVGDALVKFTNGLLRSNVHRVDPPISTQGHSVRYSLGYFSRPADNVVLKRLDGCAAIPPLQIGQVEEERTSKDWLLSRFMGRRVGVFKGPEHWDTIQGTERLSMGKPVLSNSQRLNAKAV
jgi:isopenicillin N synthase-like dioxygenase